MNSFGFPNFDYQYPRLLFIWVKLNAINYSEKGLFFNTEYATTHTRTRKYKIDGFDKAADTATFDMGERTITVADYFKNELGKKLNYPRTPCIRVGSTKSKRKMFFPMEMCMISDDQKVTKMGEKETSAIIRKAAVAGKI